MLPLRFLACDRKRTVADLDLTDIDPQRVLTFLSYLERDRKNGVTTNLLLLSGPHVQDFYRDAHKACSLPNPKAMKQLVTAWKVLHGWG